MRELRWIAGLLLALLLPGCGSSSTPTTPATPAPTPTPCTQTTVLQVDGSVPSLTLARAPAFSASTAGRFDITVDWTFTASQIGVYLVTAGACSIDQFNANTCTFLARSETTAKPRKFSVPNVTAGNYELMVANFSTQDESISGQVVLSSATCAAFASAGRAVSMSGLRGPLSESPLR
jgi:heat shock protein HslJ